LRRRRGQFEYGAATVAAITAETVTADDFTSQCCRAVESADTVKDKGRLGNATVAASGKLVQNGLSPRAALCDGRSQLEDVAVAILAVVIGRSVESAGAVRSESPDGIGTLVAAKGTVKGVDNALRPSAAAARWRDQLIDGAPPLPVPPP
jgi:hypothetical protein